jgi:hypothetical protein
VITIRVSYFEPQAVDHPCAARVLAERPLWRGRLPGPRSSNPETQRFQNIAGSLAPRTVLEAAIRADLREGKAGITKLAPAHGVGVGTVQRIKAGLTGQPRAELGNPLLRPWETHWRP